jgi:hypothetical protein
MAVSGQPSGPILEFLTTTTLPFHEVVNEESRRIVRSHAIRDANRRKRLGTSVEGQIRKGIPAPAPQSKFTAKFRLDTKPKQPPKAKSLSKDETRDRNGKLDGQENSQKWRQQAFSFVPDVGNLDPFETFPIKLGPKQQALMHYRKFSWLPTFGFHFLTGKMTEKVSLKQNAFAFYSKEQLFAHAAIDPAWLNATLSLIALHHDLNIGKGISQECLFHRGEALRIVNARLAVSRQVNDATIGAIASLANFDVSANPNCSILLSDYVT